MNIANLVRMGLATWRLSHMLVSEEGPFDVFDHIRRMANRWEVTGKLLSCVWCSSVWVALALIVTNRVARFVVDALALSAVAVLIQDGREYAEKVHLRTHQ